MSWLVAIVVIVGLLYFLNWYGSQELPDNYSSRNSYPQIPPPKISKDETLIVHLLKLDFRRLRGQYEEVFPVKLWYADRENRVYVYPLYDDSESTRGIGVVPSQYTKSLYPFIYGKSRYYRYKGEFNKTTNELTLHLSQNTNDDYEQYLIEQRKEQAEREKRSNENWRERLKKGYKPQKDLIQVIQLRENTQFKGRRTLKNPTLRFLDKKFYENEDNNRVFLIEDGNEVLSFSADKRLIRAYYAGYKCIISDIRFVRIRYDYGTDTDIILTVSYKMPS